MNSLQDQLESRQTELSFIKSEIAEYPNDDKHLFDLFTRESELEFEISDIQRWIETGVTQ
jgi:hypothetical protein